MKIHGESYQDKYSHRTGYVNVALCGKEIRFADNVLSRKSTEIDCVNCLKTVKRGKENKIRDKMSEIHELQKEVADIGRKISSASSSR